MRGADSETASLFSYVSCEARVPADHPLRVIRAIVDEALDVLSGRFEAPLFRVQGRPSIPPEKLLRALLLRAFFGLRSERQLMEQLNYNLLFRWFVGLSTDAPVWDASTFGKKPRAAAGRRCSAADSWPRSSEPAADQGADVIRTSIAWMASHDPGLGEPEVSSSPRRMRATACTDNDEPPGLPPVAGRNERRQPWTARREKRATRDHGTAGSQVGRSIQYPVMPGMC